MGILKRLFGGKPTTSNPFEGFPADAPKMIQWHWLMMLSSDNMSLAEMQERSKREGAILDTMVQRNMKAIELERAGKIDAAIVLLEQNVSDLFDGTHPYERLRILYTKQKRYADAIRVCDAFVAHRSKIDAATGRQSSPTKAESEFSEWAAKLRAKYGAQDDA